MKRPTGITGLLCLLCAGCASHLSVGGTYQSQDSLPLAVEYYDAGLAEDPGNQALKDAFIVAEQTYQWRLRRQLDRLVEAHSYLQAIKIMAELQERALRMQHLTLPGEDPAQLDREYARLKQLALTQLEQDLDTRANRSYVLNTDLRACRQLLALGGQDSLLERRCEKILNSLKLLADIQVEPRSYPEGFHLVAPLQQAITLTNPELLQIVPSRSERKNATIVLYLGTPQVQDTGWFVAKRDAYHQWTKQLDRHGRPLKKTITIKPPQAKIDAARKAGQNPPQPQKKEKYLWEQIRGEYTHYESVRSVEIPYRVTVRDQKTQTDVARFDGSIEQRSQSGYYHFAGDSRARKSISGNEGRHQASPMLTVSALIRQARNALPDVLSKTILHQID